MASWNAVPATTGGDIATPPCLGQELGLSHEAVRTIESRPLDELEVALAAA